MINVIANIVGRVWGRLLGNTTLDGKQVVMVIGDSNAFGSAPASSDTPVPGTGVLYDSTGSVLNPVDSAYILANNIGRSAWPQFAIDYNAATTRKVVIVNNGLSSSAFNSTTTGLSWDTNGPLYAAAVTKTNSTLSLLHLTKPKVIFVVLGINDTAITIGKIQSLIDRLRTNYSGVDIVLAQQGDDLVRTNPVALRALIKQACTLYSNVYIGCNMANLLGNNLYQANPHPLQLGYNAMGSMFARWMMNSSYTKWARSIISCHYDELSTARKTLIENWITALGSLYFTLDQFIPFKTTDARNIFNDWSLLQEPQNPGAAVFTANDSIATNGTTYFTVLRPQFTYSNASLSDVFHTVKIKTNSTAAGTLAHIFGGQFGTSLVGIKQQVASNLVFSCVDGSSGLTYSGQASLQDATSYTCARNSGNEIGYINGIQVSSGAVGQVNTPGAIVIGGRNTVNTYPAATLADGITASVEYFACGKQSTMNHSTLTVANETLINNWNSPSAPTSPSITRFYSSRFVLNNSGSTPTTEGEGIQTFTEQVSAGATANLTYQGITTGMIRHQPGNDDIYTNTPEARPAWSSKNGNFVYITNSALNIRFQNSSGISIAGAVSAMYCVRFVDFITNESLWKGSNGFSARDRVPGSGDAMEGGSFNTNANWVLGTGHIIGDITYMNKLLLVEQERDGSGNLRMWVNGVPWAAGAAIAVGSGNLTNFYIGNNGHPQFSQFYAGGIYSGLRDVTKMRLFKAWCEYYHGTLGSYPVGYPSVSLDNGTTYVGTCTWNSGTKAITAPTLTTHISSQGYAIVDIESRLYNLTTATVDPGIETRTYVKTKKMSTDPTNYNKFFRGTDYGISAGATTGVMYCIEFIAVDSAGNRQPIPSVTYPFLDNQA